MNSPAENTGKAIPIDTSSLYEKHKTIYARSVSGVFNNWRWGLVFFTQALFYGLCWIDWNGRQAVLFHLVERKFYIFGMVFWPQDVIYLAILLVISAYALFLATAVGGRLFCGYACPQTVYTEILMWIETKIEGERPARMKLDAQPMSPRKFRLKFLKHALWLVVALWTGITFVGYFTPIKELLASALSFSLGPWELFWTLFYAAFLYMQAGFLREQVCKYMCPYARFQGVMFDPDTLIITYDPERGEPRGARRKNADPGAQKLGDCVDCGICVQVCPTGIDIREGLQNECIGCAACIDACDQVMDKMKYPRGLIRYSTENAVEQGFGRNEIVRRTLRLRPMLYLGALLLIGGAGAWSLATRMPLKVGIEKERAALYRESDNGNIENAFRMHLTNASEQAREFRIEVAGLPGIRLDGGGPVSVPAAGMQEITLSVQAEAGSRAAGSHPIVFTVIDAADPEIRVDQKASFWLP